MVGRAFGVVLANDTLLAAARGIWHRTPGRVRTALMPHVTRGVVAGIERPGGDVVTALERLGQITPYRVWLEVNELNERRTSLLARRLAAARDTPLLSVVVPVHDPPIELLRRAVASVRGQLYRNWELCIVDDASADPGVAELLAGWAGEDPRIRFTRLEHNVHISAATNQAARAATGEFLVFLDQDDELAPDALAEVALRIAARPATQVVYTDDDRCDANGRRYAPHFKPDWSPELLLSDMYLGHLFAVRRSLYEELDGMREGFEGAQDFDFSLRATERTDAVEHVPRVLYHWRAHPGSTAMSGLEKPYAFDAGRRAVQEALERRGVTAEVIQPDWARARGCGFFEPRFPDEGPSVAVIVATRNHIELLRRCLDSLAMTTYRNVEFVIADNESDEPQTLRYLRTCGHRVLRIGTEGRFDFARLNNEAAACVDAEYVLFLNNDTEVVTPEWLSQMMGYAQLQGVGAVGAKLVYTDGRIQHAGIVHGLYGGLAGPAFKLLQSKEPGYMGRAAVASNWSAVTAACLLVRRAVFEDLGGFDQRAFPVAYNDVDFCYRLVGAGHRVVCAPSALLLHHEGASRGFDDDPRELAEFRRRYGGRRDPYYNPNLSLDDERFEIAATTIAPDEGLPPIRMLAAGFTLNWEGAPRSQFELIVGLRERGVIDPVVYSPSEGPLRAEYEAAGIPVHVFPPPTRDAFTEEQYAAGLARMAATMEDLAVELVYANTMQTFYAVDAAASIGLPSVLNPRESEPWQTYFDFLTPPLRERALASLALPYRVVFVADATRRAWSALDTKRSFTTIHNRLAVAAFEKTLERSDAARAALGVDNDILVLTLGTVTPRKGQLDLVRAFALMDEDAIARTRALIVGDRPSEYSDELHAALAALEPRRRQRVQIVGETGTPGRHYAAADVFACTSRVESSPRVILEAMAAGLPIVTTPVFGIAEQVRPGRNALTYDPGDVAALAAALDRMVLDDDLRTTYAAASADVLASLGDYEAMLDDYARTFREAWLSGAPRARPERGARRRRAA